MSLSHPEIKTRPGDKSVLGMRVHSLQLGATQHAVAATSGRVSLAKARRVEALTFAEHMSLFFFWIDFSHRRGRVFVLPPNRKCPA